MDARQFIFQFVKEHYSKSTKPLMLADIGTPMRGAGAILPDGMSLGKFIEINFSNEFFVIQNKSFPARIAVATAETLAAVKEQIDTFQPKSFRVQIARDGKELEEFPRALLIAFCRSLAEGQKIYIRINSPIRYWLGVSPPDLSYIEIESQFRLPGIIIGPAGDVPSEIRRRLFGNISAWMKFHGVAPDHFQRVIDSATISTKEQGRTALDRLIEAQESDVRERLLIPADIIQILSRMQ